MSWEQPLPVASHHLVSLTGESGWIAGYKLNLLNGLPQAAVEGDTYTPPGYSGHPVLEPDHVVEVGDNVRGVCFFSRLGQAYIAITRCAYLKNYPCAVEFHFLPEEKTVSAGGGSFSNSYTLDGGIPPSKAPAKPKVRAAQWSPSCAEPHTALLLLLWPAPTMQGQRGSSERRQRPAKPSASSAPGQKPEEKEVEARGSVALKMRVPMGAESLKYYADAKNSMFLISFSSGATAIEVLCRTPH